MAKIININDAKQYPNSVLVYGHFSSLHHGHIRFLNAAKSKDKKLVVAVMEIIQKVVNKNFSSIKKKELKY